MGLPHTLIGMVGFMLFVGFLSSQILEPGANQIPSNTFRENLTGDLNKTSDSGAGGLFQAVEFASTILKAGKTIIGLATFQIEGLPLTFSIFFDLVVIQLVLLIIILIRGGT